MIIKFGLHNKERRFKYLTKIIIKHTPLFPRLYTYLLIMFNKAHKAQTKVRLQKHKLSPYNHQFLTNIMPLDFNKLDIWIQIQLQTLYSRWLIICWCASYNSRESCPQTPWHGHSAGPGPALFLTQSLVILQYKIRLSEKLKLVIYVRRLRTYPCPFKMAENDNHIIIRLKTFAIVLITRKKRHLLQQIHGSRINESNLSNFSAL